MKRTFFLLVTAALFSAIACSQPALIRVLVVTGGHDYNQSSFTDMFESMSGSITYRIVPFPEAYSMFKPEMRKEFDAVVFYHMWQSITDEQKTDMTDCFRKGKPLVVLHHSICAFDNWEEYTHITGGRYFHDSSTVDGKAYPPSTYKHDVNVSIFIKDPTNPVTRGISDFVLFDEVYGGLYVKPGVTPLLSSGNPASSPVIGWSLIYGNTRVVTLQPGHDTPAFESPVYRKLLHQAIEWAYRGD